jgi:hypothetical protein
MRVSNRASASGDVGVRVVGEQAAMAMAAWRPPPIQTEIQCEEPFFTVESVLPEFDPIPVIHALSGIWRSLARAFPEHNPGSYQLVLNKSCV